MKYQSVRKWILPRNKYSNEGSKNETRAVWRINVYPKKITSRPAASPQNDEQPWSYKRMLCVEKIGQRWLYSWCTSAGSVFEPAPRVLSEGKNFKLTTETQWISSFPFYPPVVQKHGPPNPENILKWICPSGRGSKTWQLLLFWLLSIIHFIGTILSLSTLTKDCGN